MHVYCSQHFTFYEIKLTGVPTRPKMLLCSETLHITEALIP